jgi:hypothetical protein
MANIPITQLPPTLGINGGTDYLEIAQFVGPPVNYASRRILAKNVGSLAALVVTGTFTLAINQTTTVVIALGCVPTSRMSSPCPLTPHAAASMASTSYTMGTNQFTVTHASNSQSDRTFMYVLFF